MDAPPGRRGPRARLAPHPRDRRWRPHPHDVVRAPPRATGGDGGASTAGATPLPARTSAGPCAASPDPRQAVPTPARPWRPPDGGGFGAGHRDAYERCCELFVEALGRDRPGSRYGCRGARYQLRPRGVALAATVRPRVRQPLDVSRSFRIEWTARAAVELDHLRAFDRPPIRRAVGALEHQALTETINRKPLREPLATLPDATWEVRVDRHRVLYRVDGGQSGSFELSSRLERRERACEALDSEPGRGARAGEARC